MTGEQLRIYDCDLTYRGAILNGGMALTPEHHMSQWAAGSDMIARSTDVLVHKEETAGVVGK